MSNRPNAAFLLVPLVAACANPEDVAREACEAIPVLAAPAADLALYERLLVPNDAGALKAAAPTRGLEAVGADGLARLRAQTTCTVTHTERIGPKGWTIKLERLSPEVKSDGTFGEPVKRVIEYAVDADMKVDAGIAKAAQTRASAEDALNKKEWQRFASTWKSVGSHLPDPLLAVDVAWATEQEVFHTYGGRLDIAATGLEGTNMKASVANKGPRNVSEVVVRVVFKVKDEEKTTETTIRGLSPGAEKEFLIPLPTGATEKDRFRFEAVSWKL